MSSFLTIFFMVCIGQLLDNIFNGFANLWMNMKVQSTTKEDVDSQLYKFKPRVFEIEKVIEADVGKSLDNENSSEVELLSEDESTDMVPHPCRFIDNYIILL